MVYKTLQRSLQRFINDAEAPYEITMATAIRVNGEWNSMLRTVPVNDPLVGLKPEDIFKLGYSKSLSRKLESLGKKSVFAKYVLDMRFDDSTVKK